MIFPNNVHKRAVEARKLMSQDKTAIFMQFFIIANVVCFFILRFVFQTFLGLGTGWAILAQLILFLVVGVMLFRIVIFKEDEKIREMQDRQSDSFARFLYVRKDNISTIDVADKKINVFEYTNGCITATIRFKFGSNNDAIAKTTAKVLEEIYGIICMYNFEFCTDAMPEVFSNSAEYRRHLTQINSVRDKKLSLVLRTISKIILTKSEESCNTDVLYISLKSKIPGDKEQLENILVSIIKVLSENITCFRSVEFLDIDQLLEFYRDYYLIEAIDLAMMKAIDLSANLNDEYSKLISLYSLQATDGKSYRVSNNSALDFKTKERELS